MRDEDVAVWLASDMVGEEISKMEPEKGGGITGFFVTSFLIFLLGFSIFAISGISWDSLWNFVKIISLPFTFDYQLFGWNHYASAAVSAAVVLLTYACVYVEKFFYNVLYVRIQTTRLNKYFIYRMFTTLATVIYDFIIFVYTYVLLIWMVKLFVHGFFSFWKIIFSF